MINKNGRIGTCINIQNVQQQKYFLNKKTPKYYRWQILLTNILVFNSHKFNIQIQGFNKQSGIYFLKVAITERKVYNQLLFIC